MHKLYPVLTFLTGIFLGISVILSVIFIINKDAFSFLFVGLSWGLTSIISNVASIYGYQYIRKFSTSSGGD